jgi:hypothetical protein
MGMKPKRFSPEKDLAPIPFDENICLRALELKKHGLVWQPHVGCFVWDPEEHIKPDSPFPGRIYFILSLPRFLEIFGTLEQITERLVWLPTWYQARLLCQRLGISDEVVEESRQRNQAYLPADELLSIYGLILEAFKRENDQK